MKIRPLAAIVLFALPFYQAAEPGFTVLFDRKDRAWTAGLFDEARRGWLQPKQGDKAAEAAFTRQGKGIRIWLEGKDFTPEAPSPSRSAAENPARPAGGIRA